MKLKRIAILVFWLTSFFSINAQTILIDKLEKKIAVKNQLTFFCDSTNNLNYSEVIKNAKFTNINSDIPNFGISSFTFWFRIDIKNITNRNLFLFQISQPGIDEVEFYHYQNANKDSLVVDTMGENLPFGKRIFFDANYIFRIQLPKDSLCTHYIKVKARDNIQLPMFVGTTEEIFESNKIKDTLAGIYTGIMLVMLVYNLFIYFTVRDKSYLYYVIYIATVMLTQAGIQGYAFQYLYPNNIWLAQHSSFILPPLVGIAGMYFMRVFLNTVSYFPKLSKLQHLLSLGYITAFILALAGYYQNSFVLIEVCAALVSIYMISLAVLIHKKGYRPATFFLIAWSFFLVGVSLYVMKDLGILPYNNFTFYSMPIGSAVEVVLLSFALADRINILKKEKEQSQAEALFMLQQNERLIREQNVVLEQKVHERTIELEETNEELSATLQHLKDTQTQLVDAEKMASLGQLTAGIAHEINNPINFVAANVAPIKMDINEMYNLIEKYTILHAVDDFERMQELLSEAHQYKKEIDLDYIKQEMNLLLQGIEDGARRTAEIVQGLKNFSRLDETDLKKANINEGIESTLVLLTYNLPYQSDIIKELDVNMPLIECLPGKLNQVFMNLFSNSLYAIGKVERDIRKYLKITTSFDDENVYVIIEDNGIGMKPEVKAKIFEPFFTTKDVGEGTGLGMSIVFKIIETHKASIEVESEFGIGTKIKLTLKRKLISIEVQNYA